MIVCYYIDAATTNKKFINAKNKKNSFGRLCVLIIIEYFMEVMLEGDGGELDCKILSHAD